MLISLAYVITELLSYFKITLSDIVFCKEKYISSSDVDFYLVIAVQGSLAILSCPVDSSGGKSLRKISTWYKGSIPASETLIAKMVIWNITMRFNKTFGDKSRDMSITFPNGNLALQNATFDDAGYYTCRSTGTEDATIYLNIAGLLEYFVDISMTIFLNEFGYLST